MTSREYHEHHEHYEHQEQEQEQERYERRERRLSQRPHRADESGPDGPFPTATDERPVIAFFDADETLIAMKTPFSLLRYRLRQQGDVSGAEYERRVEPLRRLAALGVTPVEVVSRFYELFEGVPWDEVRSDARDWYAELRAQGCPFVEPVVARLRRHREARHHTVVVSGSWPATLQPMAEDLGIDLVLCTEPGIDARGRMDGTIRHAMFGPAKGDAMGEALAKFGADPADCYAYGDDPGDLTMLRRVGRPTVVGEHPTMVRTAAEEGWEVLPARLAPGTRRQPV
ncbi:HAD family hydrolase [Streptomyces sp. NPDC057245]|uniref:HAD family hydrolase n=1 Tax=Streptomyces sp. NPDC057245 TaxID=3346065 RepID=UPI003631A425